MSKVERLGTGALVSAGTTVLAKRLLRMERRNKRALALSLDIVLCVGTVFVAMYLRLGEWVLLRGTQWTAVLLAVGIAIPLFANCGLYRAIFRHTGWPSAIAVAIACSVYGVLYSLVFTFIQIDGVPRTVGLIQPVLLFIGVAGTRGIAHYVLSGSYIRVLGGNSRRKALIYGAGAAGRQLAAALSSSQDMEVVGFLDDDPTLHGALAHRFPVFSPAEAARVVDREDVTDVLLAIPSASRARRREVLDLFRPFSVSVQTVPGLLDLATGRQQVVDLQPLEIEDLLGRDPVDPDQSLMRQNIAGKTVLVTGGGGSIGRELARQILACEPARLLILDASEYALYTVDNELRALQTRDGTLVEVVPLLASVLDEARIRAILDQYRPQTIYHAAAYKHVHLVEANPLDGLRNNVFGTRNMVEAARRTGVSDFILISTDKAVRPTNIMGASKRLAELVVQAHAADASNCTYSIVRFGNVLGSSGSVVPLFYRQINEGGPVTVTHPQVTRYFMTIPEAAQLVIQASAMAEGGDVFVLDMGDPVRVIDLARNMIRLCGLEVRDERHPDGDIEIKFIGLRPGEKLFEELLIGNNPHQTSHRRIMRAEEAFLPLDVLTRELAPLAVAIDEQNAQGAIARLLKLVPEYAPEKGGGRVPPTRPLVDAASPLASVSG